MGGYDPIRPNYVRNSAFHNGYSAAIGIADSSNAIPIENNVIHHTLDYGITVAGNSSIIRNNLVMLNYWSSTFVQSEAQFNEQYLGAIDVSLALSVVLENNYVAGAQRVGINYRGDSCYSYAFGSMAHSIKNNTVVGALGGVVILPDSRFGNLDCIKISGFTVFKSVFWGIYYQGPQSVIVDSNVLVDNQVNVFAMVIGPSILGHVLSNKFYTLSNMLIVGKSSTFNCTKDVRPSDFNELFATNIASFSGKSNGFVGCVWANFLSGANGAPVKPW